MEDSKRTPYGDQRGGDINSVKIDASKSFIEDANIGKAKEIASDLAKDKLSVTKVRQYFEDIKGLKRKIDSNINDLELKVQIRLIKSRAAYDEGREKEKFRKFRSLLDECLEKVLKSNSIRQETKEFIVFFETVYGYFYRAKN